MSNTRPYRLIGKHCSLENLTCSKDGTPTASTNAQLEILLYTQRYSSLVGHALDGSIKSISSTDAKLVERKLKTVTCNLLKFVKDDLFTWTVVHEVISYPDVIMEYFSRFVSELSSYAKENTGDDEELQWSKLKIEGIFECLTVYEYSEGLAIAMAVRSSEEEQRIRKLQMAVETMLIEEMEWGSIEGTCGVCLEGFESGEKLDRMPCKHCFHRDCVRMWLIKGKNSSCPLCRFAIE